MNCKLFNNPIKMMGIIMWNIWDHRNQVIFKNIQLNPFLVIEKDIVIFQNLQYHSIDPHHLSEGYKSSQIVKKLIRWIPPIYDRFKLNFDDPRIKDTNALGWVIRDSNSIIKTVGCMTVRDGILATKNIIDCYNKMINILSYVINRGYSEVIL